MKKVVVVEDQRILRESYKSLFQNTEYEVVGEASDGITALRCIAKYHPDIVLLDLSLPKMDGFSVLKEIGRHAHGPKVLIITMNDSEERIEEAFTRGANGFLLKDAAGNEMISAMNEVLKGHRYISPSIASKVVGGYIRSKTNVFNAQPPKPMRNQL